MVVFQSGGEKTAGYRRTSQIYILAFQLYEREQLGEGREETKRFFMRKFALRARVAYIKVCFSGIVSGDNFLIRPIMDTYTLPRDAFDILVESLGGKQKAEVLARTLETAIGGIQQRAKEEISEQKQLLKVVLKDGLKQELVTREIFEERSNVMEERFKSLEAVIAEKFKLVDEKFKIIDEKFSGLHFKMNIFIAIALIALTFANPTFVELIKKIF
jgi:hypothetical protein